MGRLWRAAVTGFGTQVLSEGSAASQAIHHAGPVGTTVALVGPLTAADAGIQCARWWSR